MWYCTYRDQLFEIVFSTDRQLRYLLILLRQRHPRVLQDIDVALPGILPHRLDKGPGHGTSRRASDTRIRTRLIVRTPAEHPHILAFPLPILHEVLFPQALLVRLFFAMLQTLEKRRRATEQHFRVLDLVRRKPAAHEVRGGGDEAHAFFDVVHEVDIAVGVGAVDVGEFDGGAGVAAVEDDGHAAAWGDCGDESAVELF